MPDRHPSLDGRVDPAIRVVEPDPAWPGMAGDEAVRIRAALAPLGVRIEHVGSTAVPGLAGKPIIDLLVAVPTLAAPEPLVDRLASLGYLFAPDPSSPGRLFFGRPHARPRAFHVHVCERGSDEVVRHLAVRDYLRARPDEAVAYEKLKRGLVERAPGDRLQYIAGKAAHMAELERRALAWAAS